MEAAEFGVVDLNDDLRIFISSPCALDKSAKLFLRHAHVGQVIHREAKGPVNAA